MYDVLEINSSVSSFEAWKRAAWTFCWISHFVFDGREQQYKNSQENSRTGHLWTSVLKHSKHQGQFTFLWHDKPVQFSVRNVYYPCHKPPQADSYVNL